MKCHCTKVYWNWSGSIYFFSIAQIKSIFNANSIIEIFFGFSFIYAILKYKNGYNKKIMFFVFLPLKYFYIYTVFIFWDIVPKK